MKWMGGWSWQDLCLCPIKLRDEIVRMMHEEADELERLASKR